MLEIFAPRRAQENGSGVLPSRRSRHQRRRPLQIAAQVTAIGIVLAGASGFAVLHKNVTVTIDGKSTETRTFETKVGGFLDSEGIHVDHSDIVSPRPDASLPANAEVTVIKAKPLAVTLNGKETSIKTTAKTVEQAIRQDIGVDPAQARVSVDLKTPVKEAPKQVAISTPKKVVVVADGQTLSTQTAEPTVGAALNNLGVALNQGDSVSVPADAPTVDGLTVTIKRSSVVADREVTVIPFDREVRQDPKLPKGFTKVDQPGKAGQRVVSYRTTMVDGQPTSREVVAEMVLANPQNEVVLEGTKELVAGDGSGNQAIAARLVAERGWGADQFSCLVNLWQKESGWNHTASNGSSGAYGIPQSLPGSKMASVGADWQTNPETQIIWGLNYIAGRYQTPCGAWAHSQSVNWY